MCCSDVDLLTLLGTASEQDDKRVAVLTAIDPIAWAEIQPQLKHSSTHTLCHREVAAFDSIKRNRNPRPCAIIELLKPSLEGIATQPIDVLSKFNPPWMVA